MTIYKTSLLFDWHGKIKKNIYTSNLINKNKQIKSTLDKELFNQIKKNL